MTRPTRPTRWTRPQQQQPSNRQEHELSSQSGQMVQGRGVALRRNRVGNLGVLKATNGNATKRSTSHVTTSAGKSAEAVIKQFATQELQAEKRKDEGMEGKRHARSGAQVRWHQADA